MPSFTDSAAPVLLTDATALFAGIRDTPEIAALLLPYQIEVEDEVAEGLALVEEVQAAMGHQRAEAAEASAATAAATAALTTLEVGYVRLRKLVRAAYKPGSPALCVITAAAKHPPDRSGRPTRPLPRGRIRRSVRSPRLPSRRRAVQPL